ncbi:MAG: DUF1805 domain-containing protein [Candidatus Omnitrophica bacterium]|jgi:uncharacterized protein YunC (DUF1805 family)|nr:DUF1805 domain-containing protein [Candidatus Omnitrophota bacterium]
MRALFKKIRVGKKYITALLMPLKTKNLIVLHGRRGYVMCGYLNLKVAEKFNDVAVKIVGVRTINDALCASVHSCTSAAARLGIKKGQPVKDVLGKIA